MLAFKDVFFISKQMFTTCSITILHFMADQSFLLPAVVFIDAQGNWTVNSKLSSFCFCPSYRAQSPIIWTKQLTNIKTKPSLIEYYSTEVKSQRKRRFKSGREFGNNCATKKPFFTLFSLETVIWRSRKRVFLFSGWRKLEYNRWEIDFSVSTPSLPLK